MNPRSWLPALVVAVSAFAAAACDGGQIAPDRVTRGPEAEVLELADRIFAAARARDAARFASFFSDGRGFVYLINTRQLTSRETLQTMFQTMLARQRAFEPQWGARRVQMLTPSVGVLTGEFATRATSLDGHEWEAHGMVTFVAVRDTAAWRVVNWHTSE